MSDWQPIETVPRDGTSILGWHVKWHCPVSIFRTQAVDRDYPWVETTKGNAWPEKAFSHWHPQLNSPQ